MIEIFHTPNFMRQLKNLDDDLQDEVLDKIELFKNSENHKALKVHKLKGRLKGRYGFSANYKTRIIFNYLKSKNEVLLLSVGDHNIYN